MVYLWTPVRIAAEMVAAKGGQKKIKEYFYQGIKLGQNTTEKHQLALCPFYSLHKLLSHLQPIPAQPLNWLAGP